ncbi:hypothetical protein FGG79_03620 [Bacillus sp. BHET2]|uniref:hypothetical protein n=1 Tax=Bacillus sp. BHET2 TaxID=2583818 RepID=UPI00110E4075|nr:hypothetical protein [Bacillus sp. BHET2]TMU87236.1 hypothetical protein FGG79_03620 [Bacillus sp. BHET2]
MLTISFVIANLRKLRWEQVRKRILTFAMLFIPLSISHFLLNEYVTGSETELWDLGIPFGVSVGLAFSDLMSWKKKERDVVG